MIQITPRISLNDDELSYEFIRAAGPGGQNVNKVSTSVQLRFDVLHSPSLDAAVKDRLSRLAGTRMTKDGVLLIEARRYRTQEQNKHDAEARLAALIQKALIEPKKRRPTRPSFTSVEKRLESKKHRSLKKRLRQDGLEGF